MNLSTELSWSDKLGVSTVVLAATLLLAPGLGVYSDRMLQDTLKSMIVAFGSLLALGLWLSSWRTVASPRVLWHDVVVLPLLLAAYALVSMVWSHTYLAGVELARWLLLAVVVLLVVNLASIPRARVLLAGLHLGAVVAATWAVLQFWFDLNLFAQGPNPASTFVNRNFLAEFLVLTVPAGIWLLANVQGSGRIGALAASNAWVVLALLMTGTRSALVALLVLTPLLLWWGWAWRGRLAVAHWSRTQGLWAATVITVVVAGMGQIPSGNAAIVAEHGQVKVSALERALRRTSTVASPTEYQSGSFSMRVRMWETTARMIVAHPWAGVGAGAWEVHTPLFQEPDTPVETDYYAHNEPLQLLAEYGLFGWLVLGLLLTYGVIGVRRSLRLPADADPHEAPLRLVVLLGLGALGFVSSAGFPLHLAATGVAFALYLGILAASDARMASVGGRGTWVRGLEPSRRAKWVAMAAWMIAVGTAVSASVVAAKCENLIVRAVSSALHIQRSGISPQDPGWAPARQAMLRDIAEGIALNPHYRKITPILADQLALWGDWKNAIWIWESVAASRPYVVGLHANIARGYLVLGNIDKARQALAKATQIQPDSRLVKVVSALYLARSGQVEAAAAAFRPLLADGNVDLDTVNAAYQVGMRINDLDLSLQAIGLRLRHWPSYSVESWLQMGAAYHAAGPAQADKALEAYRTAWQMAPAQIQAAVRQRIPAPLRAQVEAGGR